MLKEVEVRIENGKDAGKVFKVKEMPALQMDRWAMRALCLLGRSEENGVVGLLQIKNLSELLSSFSRVDYEKAEPLLVELLECCYFMKDGTPVQLKPSFVDGILEDWTTITRLRIEALKVNLGFLEQGDGLKSG